MNRQVKISFLWFLIVVGYIFHSTYHLSGVVFFGVDVNPPAVKGEVPTTLYVIRIVLEVLTLLLVLLSLYLSGKGFRWFSFIWAVILGILNAVHLVETIVGEPSELSQLALLTFILAANVMLAIETIRQIRATAG